MTPPPGSYPDTVTPTTAGAPSGNRARQFTEPLRELCVLALLVGNAVFLILGFSSLFFVLDGWASGFGARCASVFSTFVGPVSLGLPMAALLLSTHVSPILARARLIIIVVLSELGVSALLGALTFLGAFAHDLESSGRELDILESTLGRMVWFGFLVFAGILAVRLWLGLFPPAPQPGYPAYTGPLTPGQPTYGQPYPGQPVYPQQATMPVYQPASVPPVYPPTYPSAPAAPGGDPTMVTAAAVSGWPVVPPPPMPEPLVVAADPTVRVSPSGIVPTTGDVPGAPYVLGQPPDPGQPRDPQQPTGPLPNHQGEPTQQIPQLPSSSDDDPTRTVDRPTER